MGRPAQDGTARESTYKLRGHSEQFARWRKAAKMVGKSLAEWLRDLADTAVRTKSTRRT